MLEVNRQPTTRQLRQFAWLWLPLAAVILFGWLWIAGEANAIAGVLLAVICGIAAVTALYNAQLLRPLWVGWMIASLPAAWLISHLLLAVVYYLLLTPIAMIRRFLVPDPLNRTLDRSAQTYWVKRDKAPDASRYFRQF